jgi:hypothetical protein
MANDERTPHRASMENRPLEMPLHMSRAPGPELAPMEDAAAELDAPPLLAKSDTVSSVRQRPLDFEDDGAASDEGSVEGASERTAAADDASLQKSAASEPVSPANIAESLRERIAEQLPTLRETGRAEVQMNLHPPELGRIQIHLTMHDGNMSVQMTVQDDTVKRLLDQQLEPLRVRLNELGVGIGQFDIRRDGGSANPQFEQDPEDAAAQALIRRRQGAPFAKIYSSAAPATSLLDVFA